MKCTHATRHIFYYKEEGNFLIEYEKCLKCSKKIIVSKWKKVYDIEDGKK